MHCCGWPGAWLLLCFAVAERWLVRCNSECEYIHIIYVNAGCPPIVKPTKQNRWDVFNSVIFPVNAEDIMRWCAENAYKILNDVAASHRNEVVLPENMRVMNIFARFDECDRNYNAVCDAGPAVAREGRTECMCWSKRLIANANRQKQSIFPPITCCARVNNDFGQRVSMSWFDFNW